MRKLPPAGKFQIFAKGAKEAGDQIWVAATFERTGRSTAMPLIGIQTLRRLDWNGSGAELLQ